MNLQLLAKSGGSGEVGCPSVYIDHDSSPPRLVVQGDGVGMEHCAHPLPGEQAVSIDLSILREALGKLP